MIEHPFLAQDHREGEFLGVDGELVFAELDYVLAIDEQFLAILELADGFLANALELRLDVIGLDGIAEFGELRDKIADLLDHEVAGVIAVDLGDGLEAGKAMLDAFENALGGGEQRVGFLVARLDEGNLARLEGAGDVVALVG